MTTASAFDSDRGEEAAVGGSHQAQVHPAQPSGMKPRRLWRWQASLGRLEHCNVCAGRPRPLRSFPAARNRTDCSVDRPVRVMALTPPRVFMLLSALNGVFTGLAAAPTAALTADVLPSEADDATTAADPARDANLFTLAGTLPSTVLPLVGAALPGASHPQQRARVYRTFFWTQAALSIGSIWMLAWVDPWAERARARDSSMTRYGRPGGYGEVPTDYSKGHTVRARVNRS